jgi:ribosomal protein L33
MLTLRKFCRIFKKSTKHYDTYVLFTTVSFSNLRALRYLVACDRSQLYVMSNCNSRTYPPLIESSELNVRITLVCCQCEVKCSGKYRVAQKERMFLKWVVSACDFFLWGYLKSKD